jgi:hypothetical protein
MHEVPAIKWREEVSGVSVATDSVFAGAVGALDAEGVESVAYPAARVLMDLAASNSESSAVLGGVRAIDKKDILEDVEFQLGGKTVESASSH